MANSSHSKSGRAVTGVLSRPFAPLARRNWKRELETLLEMVPANDPILGVIVGQLEEHLSSASLDNIDE